jgi:hypothetical protein
MGLQSMRVDAGTRQYTNLPLELEAAIQWLDQLGVAYSRTRFDYYKKTLQAVESARLAGINLCDVAERLNAFASLFEVNEFVTIHLGLADRGLDTYLRPRLLELVSGPMSYVDESPQSGSNKARNTGFELSVIAHLARAGLTIEQDGGLADAVARLGDATIIVECKRPQSDARIERAICDARDQLVNRYKERKKSALTTGFVALDLTKMLNPTLSVAKDEADKDMMSRIGDAMDSLNDRYRRVWDRVRDKRTAGVLYRYSEVAWSEARRTISWNYKYGVTPITNRSVARVEVVRAIQKALDRVALSEGAPLVLSN